VPEITQKSQIFPIHFAYKTNTLSASRGFGVPHNLDSAGSTAPDYIPNKYRLLVV